MRYSRHTSPILLRWPIDVPPVPQRFPRHIPITPMRIIQQVLLRESGIESSWQLEQAGVVIEQHFTRGENEKAAIQVVQIRIGRVRVVVTPEITVRAEHVRSRQSSFVVLDLSRVGACCLREGGFIVEDAIERFGDQGIGINEQDFTVLCELEQSELGHHVAPAGGGWDRPVGVQLFHHNDGGTITLQTVPLAFGNVFGTEDNKWNAVVRSGCLGVEELVREHAGAEEVAVIFVMCFSAFFVGLGVYVGVAG